MKNYIFILGRDPELSLLEIICYLKARFIEYSLQEYDEQFAIFSIEDINFSKMIKDLGGTLKIAEFFEEKQLYNGKENKIRYAISSYDNDLGEIKDYVKEKLKLEGLKAIYVKPKKDEEQIMPSKAVNVDLELIIYKKKMARVIAVYDPSEYKKRDEKRPNFDPLKVISIRLAKILINLSGAKENNTLLDCFCGIGTILQESLLMDINVIGVDSDITSFEHCKENLRWLGEKYNKKWQVFNKDSRNLSKFVKKVDVCVTEPYLGPYLKKLLSFNEAKMLAIELENLYFQVFKELGKIVKNKIVFVIPRFRTNEGEVSINFLKIMPSEFKISKIHEKINIPIAYFDEKDRIQRFIYVLERFK
jgi:tRNA G10  N-methylase Trm11